MDQAAKIAQLQADNDALLDRISRAFSAVWLAYGLSDDPEATNQVNKFLEQAVDILWDYDLMEASHGPRN